MPSRAGGGAGAGAVIFVRTMPSPSIMACTAYNSLLVDDEASINMLMCATIELYQRCT